MIKGSQIEKCAGSELIQLGISYSSPLDLLGITVAQIQSLLWFKAGWLMCMSRACLVQVKWGDFVN